MTWRAEEQESIRVCYTVNSVVFFAVVCSSSMRHTLCLKSLQPIRTRRLIRTRKAQIREVWNSIRSRNQYRSAVFASTLLEISIDSSYKYSDVFCSRSRSRSQQDSQQDSHSRDSRIYILLSLFSFSSSVFAFTSSRLSHLLWDLKLQSWSVRYLRFSQWISSQCRSIRRNEIVVSKRSLKKRKR